MLKTASLTQMSMGQAAVALLLLGYFFIPIAPAPVHIAIFSSLALSLFSKEIRERCKVVFSEKIFRVFLIFYGILIISSFYGSGSAALKLHYLGKYLELGYMPLMAAICFSERYREKSLQLFSMAMLITLLFSSLIFLGLDVRGLTGLEKIGIASNPTVFKFQITQNFFMAFAVFIWLQRANASSEVGIKLFYFMASFIGLLNIVLMVEGRTGYLTLLALGLVWVLDQISFKKIITGFLLGCILVISTYHFVSKVQLRVDTAVKEIVEWRPNVENSLSSMGTRMEFWYNSLQIIQKAPLLGFGVAGFETEYKKIAEASDLASTVNPHNQYLLFLCQIGIVGLLAFLYLNYVIWKESARLDLHWRIWVRALILGYAAANIFNSMLLDFAEGIFFSASLAIAFAALLDGKKVTSKERGLV